MAINPFTVGFCLMMFLPAIIIRVFVAYFISQDAKKYGIDPAGYAVMGLIFGLVGLIIWWVFREDIYKKRYNAQNPAYAGYQPYMASPHNQVHAQRYWTPPPAQGAGSHYMAAYAQGPEPKGKTLSRTIICKECGHIQDTSAQGKVMLCDMCGASIRIG